MLALGVTGCHSGSGTAGASGASPAPKATPAQPAPKDVLVAATAKLAKTRYKFTFDPGCSTTVSGVVDPQRKSSQVEERSPGRDTTMDMSLLSVDSQAWLKVNDEWMNVRGQTINSPLTGKWLHLDPAKIHGAEIPVMRDFFGGPAGPAGEAFQNVRDVQKAGDDTYTGRFDMSKTDNL
ncbi:MAG TPA: hypothetical protein VHH53_02405, partial [Pseudonocardiaceae bacterium]|nr:hypothetical protein [Pseudonocardiaceae bacterium]